ncbi:MAG: heparinase, partial [Chitinophagaceae bacterium]
RNSILQKALEGGLQQTNTDGTFFALNDALKEKDFTTNELVTAISVAWNVYGRDDALLYVAQKQGRVLLNKGGVGVAAAIAANKNLPPYFPYKSLEFTDGKNGDEGGVSILRNGKANKLTTLIYKFSAHGLSHGHYDKLNYNLYDKGNEILSDYGAVRFIGVEQKYGGRYLPETKSYAAQTIAHNTLVADETSHFGAKESVAENFHADKVYSNIKNKAVQVVIAKDDNAYKGIAMKRGVYLIDLPDGQKLVADIFNAASAAEHQYDLPFHYNGDLIWSSLKYKAFTDKQEVLGKKNGYQHLWKEAEAAVTDSLVQMTLLNNRTYYTISSLMQGEGMVYFTRLGANDPNFNLRREPAMILRKKAADALFVSITEIHGSFDPINEFSAGAYASVKSIKILQQDAGYTVAEILLNNKKLVIAQHNNSADEKKAHTAAGFSWAGPVGVFYDGKKLN